MTFKLAIAQAHHPADKDVISLVRNYASKASTSNADLLIFPESLMTRFEAEQQSFLDEAQLINGPFSRSIDSIAKEYEIWIAYTLNEQHESNGNPYNTLVITGSDGAKRAVYRKVHLFDSSTIKESSRMSAGDTSPEPIETPFGKMGFGICYDLRFPELSRKQALLGCDILFFPAAWVDGPGKELQWETLLRARAIENEIFVVGICRPDEGYVGKSFVFGPDGSTIAESTRNTEELMIADIDLAAIDDMREKIPVFNHMRPEIY